jgi:thymidine phosphorylase
MLFTDVIRRKRDGGELSDDEIRFFVDGLADESLPAEQVSSLAMAIFLNSMSFEGLGHGTRLVTGRAGWACRRQAFDRRCW